jgi:predicted nucleotidyltransferase
VIPGTILLSGVVGSTAYGLDTADSDVDRLGVFAAPTVAFHGLHRPKESHVTIRPDATFHEAAKWVRLALGGNPTVTELAWLDDYETMTPLGRELIGLRSSLLSAKRVRDAYLGYATQQFRKMENRGDGSFSADTRKRAGKHARHLWRLLHQGSELHQTGILVVRLTPDRAASCRAFGERVAAGDLTVVREAFSAAEAAFDGPGVLPEHPDEAAAEAWLLRVRAAMWDA